MSTSIPGAVEVVLYRSRPGVADEQLIEASDALRLQPQDDAEESVDPVHPCRGPRRTRGPDARPATPRRSGAPARSGIP